MKQVAVLGGGCFWCLEALLEKVDGITEIVSGYAGGTTPDPTYEQVCSGTTGHAEVVKVTFDDYIISYYELLKLFFTLHDPTTLDRQGHDVGNEYRSIILTTNEAQTNSARAVIQELETKETFPAPIVTEVKALTAFYPAEDYHQRYYELNPNAPYCRYVIAPKLAKLLAIKA